MSMGAAVTNGHRPAMRFYAASDPINEVEPPDDGVDEYPAIRFQAFRNPRASMDSARVVADLTRCRWTGRKYTVNRLRLMAA
jgi:hypothetical protein